MNTEPLDALDEHDLVRMARFIAKGVVLAGEQREIILMADLLEVIAKRTISSIAQAQSNLEAQKN